ncbi:unnamed protein product [Tuber aestivum]|uniref:Uncharacterized protein n=1 Tax=Tuber aestivum TaxID=59557 RepID=A0A292Q8V7_9PEZI|nr:unnamed protein product [Tuber aestivum]
MPPKRSLAPAGNPPQRGLISSFYHGIKSPENASVVRSVAVFVGLRLQDVGAVIKAEDRGGGNIGHTLC